MGWSVAEGGARRTGRRALGARPGRSEREAGVGDRTVDPSRRARGPRTAACALLAVIASAAWFGLLTGLIELAVVLVWHRLAVATVLGALQMNRHFTWMIPVAHLAVFVACGLVLALPALFRPTLARSLSHLVLATLGFFALASIVKGLYASAAGILAFGLAVQARRWIARYERGFARLQRITLPLLLGIVAVLGAVAYDRLELAEGRSLAALPAARAGAPNVLLIVLDTVRADRLSLYGYARDTAPNLTRLARRGVVFSEARSAAPWTLPSHATLFTGRWPHELGVRGDRPLDGRQPTLAEVLAKQGYATAGFVGNTYFCNSWYGLARGFLHYEDYYEQNVIVSPTEALRCTALGRWLIRIVGPAYNVRPETANTPKNAARVNADFLRWLDAHRGRPFFAFLNYIDAHDPYMTPPGFDRHFGLKPESEADLDTIRRWHHKSRTGVAPRDVELIRDAYDDCLAALDEQLGRLFAALEEGGVLRNTLVVVTADHGEELGEHALYGHGKSLYRPEVRVPLFFFGPGVAPRAPFVDEPVSLRDVAATLVERLGLAGESPLPGSSLARYWDPEANRTRPGRDNGADFILSEATVVTKVAKDPRLAPAMRGPLASVVVDGKVYIRDAMGREELYDLKNDPEEATNLADRPESRPALERCRLELDRVIPAKAVER